MRNELDFEALKLALRSKFKTCALYHMVLQAFGPVQPFKDLLKIEDKYRMVLEGLARRYDVSAPPNEWEGQVAIPVSFVEACEEAIELERENDTLYLDLLSREENPALRRVLMRMRNVSQISHLPSFKEYLEFARFGEKRVINF
ncbi:MAG: DUF2202 domain-containing protein [Alphaproteobacteria bacterium]|nr:DUF2202 domain-containing protein [Alphaproteobacteria bacterium]